MFDAKKVIIGLLIFIGIITVPIWIAVSSSQARAVPHLIKDTEEPKCIESAAYMSAEHSKLLQDWMNLAVRQNIRTYTASDGKKYTISLTGTCIKCHQTKENYCDRCHDYAGVRPTCWTCHIEPEEETR